MKDNDKHKLSDEELGDYLAGKGEVSKAYRELDDVSSPSHLDEKILARARESVQIPATRKSARNDVFIRPYATAATVFVCLAVSFLFLNNPDVPGTAELRAPQAPVSSDEQVSLEEQAPPAPVAESAARARLFADDAQEIDTNIADNAAANSPGAGNDDDAAAGPEQFENLEQLLDLVETRRLNETAQRQQPAVTSANQLTQQEATFLYRENRENWLEEIARLRETDETQRADEEAQLFLESYPETDLEAALQALETP